MTYGDPRGPNIIPFGRRTLDQLRAATRARSQSFNAKGPLPYHRATLQPVHQDRIRNGAAYPHYGEEAFRELEFSLENVLLQFKHDHPGLRSLYLCLPLLHIMRKLLYAEANHPVPPSTA